MKDFVDILMVYKNGKRYANIVPYKKPLSLIRKIVKTYVEYKRVSIEDATKALKEKQNISGDVKFKWCASFIENSNTIIIDHSCT